MTRLPAKITLAEQAAEELRRQIAAGDFKVGDLIPTETELSRDLGVSRNTVREATRSLVHAGMLRAGAGYGTVVVATSDLVPALSRRVAQNRAVDVAEVRALLEREAARLAAVRATDADRSKLRDALDARTEACDASQYVAADLKFHRALLQASGNALLAELSQGTGGNEEALVQWHSLDADVITLRSEALRELDELHHKLVDAIERHDADLAADMADQLVRLAHTTVQPPLSTNRLQEER
ncbi:FadR/GntR family transcriptional regulator [Arthrobacter sp. ISL-95]|uniref:FadR/GntR family transcriptional regulator n=1 Tax=Arthrobacter sp. ISL-95 TaxID=2819116 RepID=UPI001BE750D0|nr:FCD domain-containing protein [Arthrobacter sp. ISL-95]MBT2585417.1 FadR family transcriptional regulator [Arthrobacter sp. ISL-95]